MNWRGIKIEETETYYFSLDYLDRADDVRMFVNGEERSVAVDLIWTCYWWRGPLKAGDVVSFKGTRKDYRYENHLTVWGRHPVKQNEFEKAFGEIEIEQDN